MPNKDLVTSLELSRELKELKIPQESEFYWAEFFNKSSTVPNEKLFDLVREDELEELGGKNFIEDLKTYSAFLSGELGEIMKKVDWNLPYYANGSWWAYGKNSGNPDIEAKTEANCRGEMLAYLIKNGLITK